jgi:hypothetical protein
LTGSDRPKRNSEQFVKARAVIRRH